ncbi:MAG: leucine-rich repeat domain-containing protein [Pseudomonadota bacterium]
MPPRLKSARPAGPPAAEPAAVESTIATADAASPVARRAPGRSLPRAVGNSSQDGRATSSRFAPPGAPATSSQAPVASSQSELARKKQLNAAINAWAETQVGCNKTMIRKKVKEALRESNGPSFDFRGSGLTSLPAEIGQAQRLCWLDLTDNQLTSIPAEMGKIKTLRVLQLSNNQLTAFPAEMQKAKKLESLLLSHNRLTDFPAEMRNAVALKELNLSNNALSSFPSQLGQLKALRVLDLSHNVLQDFPEEMKQATALEQLDLAHNLLHSFPAGMAEAKSLHTLKLNNNRLSSFPAGMGQAQALRELDLDENRLTSFPVEMGQAESLCRLYLGNNRLTGFPAEMGQARALETLDLSNNRLIDFPGEMGQAKMLRELLLNNNRLSDLPAAICQSKTLRTLNMSDNQLSDLPAELGQLSNLQHLFLKHNQFIQVPRVLLDLPATVEIDLRENPLPEEEILAVREAMAQRRAAGQSVPELLMPPLAGDELRDAAANNMNVHTGVLTDAFKKRLDEVVRQFPEQLKGSLDAQRAQLSAIEARLENALDTHAKNNLTDPKVLREARSMVSLMFQKSQGAKKAYHNDFQYSAGHVLAYTFLALEAQWERTPPMHQDEARRNGMTALIDALESGSGMCDTRLCEEVMQTIGLPLSAHAQANPEVVETQAPSVSTAESREFILDEAKKVLRELLDNDPMLSGDAPPDSWRPMLTQRMQNDHPGVPAEHLEKQMEEIESMWETFHDMVLEQRPAS